METSSNIVWYTSDVHFQQNTYFLYLRRTSESHSPYQETRQNHVFFSSAWVVLSFERNIKRFQTLSPYKDAITVSSTYMNKKYLRYMSITKKIFGGHTCH